MVLPWRIERPVFVVAPPRSGSTFLFECLVQFPDLRAFTDREGTFLWRKVLPYEKRREMSDAIEPDEFGAWRRRQIRSLFYARTLLKSPASGPAERLGRLVREPRMRYLDKSIANVFRLPLLREMFPDATFVSLVRDPRANIASMIHGWSETRFQKPVLTRILREHGSQLPHWTFGAPPGWRYVLDRSLPEICAWSWQQHAEAMLRFHVTGDDGPLIRYEDLVADPLSVVKGLAGRLGLEVTPAVVRYLDRPPRSRTTLRPADKKARDEDVAAQVEAVLPLVAETAARFGY